VLRSVRRVAIAIGCLLLLPGIVAFDCGGGSSSTGGSSGDVPKNGLIVSGAVTEIVTFSAYSCPDELQGSVTSGGAGPVDLSYRNGTISFTDRDGTTYSGSGSFKSNGSGGMTIDTDLKSSSGKTIHLKGGSPCK
jgi:hypothetical protein